MSRLRLTRTALGGWCDQYRVAVADEELRQLLDEQIAYYRARGPEYLNEALEVLPSEIKSAVDEFAPGGDVLELACGPGTWTPQLLKNAATVTAVDASPEMLAIARRRVGEDDRVRFVLADLFTWQPDRQYDVVFFGFWLSHVPLERFAEFWKLVDDCLVPGGRCNSSTTPIGRPRSSSRVRRRRRFDDGLATARRIARSRSRTHRVHSCAAWQSWAGTLKCLPLRDSSSGAPAAVRSSGSGVELGEHSAELCCRAG